MQMNEDFVLEIQLADHSGASLELANVIIDALLYMQGRLRYRFDVGVTDAHGRLLSIT